jgi:hypothetical protein
MELEALLLGLEPVTALVIGVGALVLAPAIGAIDSLTGNSLSESTRNAAKTGLILALDAFEKTQKFAAEAGESFQDLMAEANAERATANNGSPDKFPKEVTILDQ